MRRFRRPAVTVSKRRVILFRLFLVFCAAFAVFSVLDNRLRPVITTMAQYQCRVVSVLAMNEAVMEELNEVQDIEQALVEVDKAPDGTVSAIEINSVEVNRLKTRLTDAVANRLLSVPKQDVRIPLGTLLGWQIMAGEGRTSRCRWCRHPLCRARSWTHWRRRASTRHSTASSSVSQWK